MTEKNVIHPAVRIAMDFVEDNCDRPLSLEVLARHVGISAFHFHRLFRASAGQPLGEIYSTRASAKRSAAAAFDRRACGHGRV